MQTRDLGRSAAGVSLLIMAVASSSANANCTDPLIEGNQTNFSGDNCHYQMVELPSWVKAKTVDGADCEGRGSTLANCILKDNVAYKVQRWIYSPDWADFSGGSHDIPAGVRTSASAEGDCTDPAIEGNQTNFSGENCHYQMVELPSWAKAKTVDGADCEGRGSTLANCILKDNVAYRVQRWVYEPDWADFSGGSHDIAAGVRSGAVADCSAPVILGNEAVFSGDNCHYQMVDPNWDHALTVDGGTCEGRGSELANCILQDNVPYVVQRWVYEPDWADFSGGSHQIPAGVRSPSTDTEHPHPGTDLPRNNNPSFQHGVALSEFSYDDTDPADPDKKAIKFHQTDQYNNDPLLTVDLDTSDDQMFGANDRGRQGDGNFRVSCQHSHFAYSDPIVKPGVENGSHLHMYFGKTDANHDSYSAESMTGSGGGSCSGSVLNRSAYWMPALMTSDTEVVVPETIFIYYKSSVICGNGYTAPPVPWSETRTDEFDDESDTSSRYHGFINNGYICVKNEFAQSLTDADGNFINLHTEPDGRSEEEGGEMRRPSWTPGEIKSMPQGLQLIAGTASTTSFDTSRGDSAIFWSCGANGHTFKDDDGKILFDHIPSLEDCRYDNSPGSKKANPWHGGSDERSSDVFAPLNATIYFPQCMKNHSLLHNRNTNSDGSYVASGASNEFKAGGIMGHMDRVDESVNCPAGYPVRIPRLGILAYWDIEDVSSTNGWFLASDKMHNSHGDMDWVSAENRSNPEGSNHERGGTLHADWLGGWHDDVQTAWLDKCLKKGVNCSIGQTGARFALKGLLEGGLDAMTYTGEKYFSVSAPSTDHSSH